MNKKDILLGLGIAIFVALCLILKFWLGDSLNPPIQCGIVVEKEFKSIQYNGQGSYGLVKIMSGNKILGFKSFSTQDYVVVGETVCKRDVWKKQDEYIKNPLR